MSSKIIKNYYSDETIDYIALILYTIDKRCDNCGETDTSMWRRGRHDKKLNIRVTLCNPCGLRYSKKQFCPHCNYIYKKHEINVKYWTTCIICDQSTHINCLPSKPNDLQYICPNCIDKSY